MSKENKEIVDTLNAFLTLEEILAFDGILDTSKDDAERKQKIEKAAKFLHETAKKKNITVEELHKKILSIVNKVYDESKKNKK